MGPRAAAQYLVETTKLRKVACNPKCRWRWTTHALERMAERGIAAADVQRAVKTGRVVLHELKRDLVWRVEGADVDGGRIQVLLTVYETEIRIKIITAF
jgi:Domain of unknown function (DUF4258)